MAENKDGNASEENIRRLQQQAAPEPLSLSVVNPLVVEVKQLVGCVCVYVCLCVRIEVPSTSVRMDNNLNWMTSDFLVHLDTI